MVLASLTELAFAYGDLLYAVWILAISILIGKTVFFLFRHHYLNIEDRAGLHGTFADEVKTPFYLIVGTLGLFYAFTSLEILSPYYFQINGAFAVIGALLGVYIARKAVHTIVLWYAGVDKKRIKIEKTSLMSLRNLIDIFIYGIAAVVILNAFGVEITPFLASLGIGGIAIALALQPTLSNYFAGMYIASDKTVRLGDYIEIDPERRGYVEQMTWRTIWLRTITGNMIIIPNSKLSETVVINYSQPKQSLLLKIPVGVAYSSDLDKVRRICIRVAKRIAKKTGGTVEGEEPFVRFYEFGESNVRFNVFFRITHWDKQYGIKDEFIPALKKEFEKEDINISFPCTNVYMHKSN